MMDPWLLGSFSDVLAMGFKRQSHIANSHGKIYEYCVLKVKVQVLLLNCFEKIDSVQTHLWYDLLIERKDMVKTTLCFLFEILSTSGGKQIS